MLCVYTKQEPEPEPEAFPLDNPQRIHFNPGSVIVYIHIYRCVYVRLGHHHHHHRDNRHRVLLHSLHCARLERYSVVVVIIEWALADCLFPLTFIFFFFFFFLFSSGEKQSVETLFFFLLCIPSPSSASPSLFVCVPSRNIKITASTGMELLLMMNLRLFWVAITVSLAISHGNPAEDCRFDLLLLIFCLDCWPPLLFSYMFVDVQETCRRRLRTQWPSAHYIQHVHTHATTSTHSCGWIIALLPLISRSLFAFFSLSLSLSVVFGYS